MKNAILLLILVVVSMDSFPEGIAYTYDKAGNRLSRLYEVILPEQRSATAPESPRAKRDSIPVEARLSDLKVTIYPNPTKGALTVDISGVPLNEKVNMRLYNPQGLQLQNINTFDGSTPIDMSSYKPGWYILRVLTTDKKNLEFKIIKE
ncbi:MAG: T9SS type A sorting domain-containing protein [Paludibacter sp.]|nr:T9SS type A sorting domain-containing protein [Paludibacter sp.]